MTLHTDLSSLTNSNTRILHHAATTHLKGFLPTQRLPPCSSHASQGFPPHTKTPIMQFPSISRVSSPHKDSHHAVPTHLKGFLPTQRLPPCSSHTPQGFPPHTKTPIMQFPNTSRVSSPHKDSHHAVPTHLNGFLPTQRLPSCSSHAPQGFPPHTKTPIMQFPRTSRVSSPHKDSHHAVLTHLKGFLPTQRLPSCSSHAPQGFPPHTKTPIMQFSRTSRVSSPHKDSHHAVLTHLKGFLPTQRLPSCSSHASQGFPPHTKTPIMQFPRTSRVSSPHKDSHHAVPTHLKGFLPTQRLPSCSSHASQGFPPHTKTPFMQFSRISRVSSPHKDSHHAVPTHLKGFLLTQRLPSCSSHAPQGFPPHTKTPTMQFPHISRVSSPHKDSHHAVPKHLKGFLPTQRLPPCSSHASQGFLSHTKTPFMQFPRISRISSPHKDSLHAVPMHLKGFLPTQRLPSCSSHASQGFPPHTKTPIMQFPRISRVSSPHKDSLHAVPTHLKGFLPTQRLPSCSSHASQGFSPHTKTPIMQFPRISRVSSPHKDSHHAVPTHLKGFLPTQRLPSCSSHASQGFPPHTKTPTMQFSRISRVSSPHKDSHHAVPTHLKGFLPTQRLPPCSSHASQGFLPHTKTPTMQFSRISRVSSPHKDSHHAVPTHLKGFLPTQRLPSCSSHASQGFPPHTKTPTMQFSRISRVSSPHKDSHHAVPTHLKGFLPTQRLPSCSSHASQGFLPHTKTPTMQFPCISRISSPHKDSHHAVLTHLKVSSPHKDSLHAVLTHLKGFLPTQRLPSCSSHASQGFLPHTKTPTMQFPCISRISSPHKDSHHAVLTHLKVSSPHKDSLHAVLTHLKGFLPTQRLPSCSSHAPQGFPSHTKTPIMQFPRTSRISFPHKDSHHAVPTHLKGFFPTQRLPPILI